MISFTHNCLVSLYMSFVAKMIEITVHEIGNHLYFLSESGALVGEILEAKGAKGHSSILKSAHAIDKRAYVAADQIKDLGLLGQRLTGSVSTFNINDAVKELMPFLPKIDGRKKISFKESLYQHTIEVEDHASKMQFAVYSVVAAYIDRLEKGSEITIKTAVINNSPTITVSGNNSMPGRIPSDKASRIDLLKTYLAGVTIMEHDSLTTIALKD
jgi:hypothetical protein